MDDCFDGPSLWALSYEKVCGQEQSQTNIIVTQVATFLQCT